MLIRREDGLVEMEWDVESVQGISAASAEDLNGILISVCNLKARGAPACLEGGGTYSLWKIQDDIEFRISVFYVANNLAIVDGRNYLLAVIGEYDEFKSMLLNACADGVSINWSDLSVQYGDSWLSMCRELASKDNWIQTKVNENPIVLSAEGLRSEQDLYCYLGESFFGYRGYAGTNLDALYDVLMENGLGCKISFKNKSQFSIDSANLTKDLNYFDKLVQVFLDAGLHLED